MTSASLGNRQQTIDLETADCRDVLFKPSDAGLAESTPLRDRMALYQAAISKQEVSPVSVSVSTRVTHPPICDFFNANQERSSTVTS